MRNKACSSTKKLYTEQLGILQTVIRFKVIPRSAKLAASSLFCETHLQTPSSKAPTRVSHLHLLSGTDRVHSPMHSPDRSASEALPRCFCETLETLELVEWGRGKPCRHPYFCKFNMSMTSVAPDTARSRSAVPMQQAPAGPSKKPESFLALHSPAEPVQGGVVLRMQRSLLGSCCPRFLGGRISPAAATLLAIGRLPHPCAKLQGPSDKESDRRHRASLQALPPGQFYKTVCDRDTLPAKKSTKQLSHAQLPPAQLIYC
jgi:hypothetical protein